MAKACSLADARAEALRVRLHILSSGTQLAYIVQCGGRSYAFDVTDECICRPREVLPPYATRFARDMAKAIAARMNDGRVHRGMAVNAVQALDAFLSRLSA
ncbi:hypothetical protein [Achromobacter sp.]|uniref:hypothetical protein n=1 Tax=Achromobacter sp. TaxID=134375 RepID=UPI0028A7E646|nr:hypothetical protein [Achromobacter sp.]